LRSLLEGAENHSVGVLGNDCRLIPCLRCSGAQWCTRDHSLEGHQEQAVQRSSCGQRLGVTSLLRTRLPYPTARSVPQTPRKVHAGDDGWVPSDAPHLGECKPVRPSTHSCKNVPRIGPLAPERCVAFFGPGATLPRPVLPLGIGYLHVEVFRGPLVTDARSREAGVRENG
jgi:hypothetical protein